MAVQTSAGALMRAAAFVDSYFDAWNHCDPKGVADHLTADGIYCDIQAHVQRTHDELVTSLSEFFSHYRHHYELIGEVLSGNDTIAFQYTVQPSDDVLKNGSAAAYRGAEFMTLHGDAAFTIMDYYDIPGMVVPGISEKSSRAMTPSRSNTRYSQPMMC